MLNFFLGMMFIYILLPILESFMSLICASLEVLRAKCSVKITRYNKEIETMNEGPVENHLIGFQYTPTEESEDIYEED